MSSFSAQFLQETNRVINEINPTDIEAVAETLKKIQENKGRLFILGVGGSAGHAGHAVNDFRKICGIESYAPTDNVSELTARTNDEGWDTTFIEYLRTSQLSKKDGVLVFSVGGGDAKKNVSNNIVRALGFAKECGAAIVGIVGRNGGYTKEVATACVVIPPLVSERITPHTEGLAAVVWHLLVSHPLLAAKKTRWESLENVR